MFVLWLVLLILLVLVSAIRPIRSEYSKYELSRRSALGDKSIHISHKRERLAPHVMSSINVVCSLLLVAITAISISVFGWPLGLSIALVISLEYGFIGQIGFIKKAVAKLYANFEKSILKFTQKFKKIIKYFKNVNEADLSQQKIIGSKEELMDLIENRMNVLTQNEKKLIINGLRFESKLVKDVMTPAEKMITIDQSEFLGPLTLSELHKTGHSKLPVVNKTINHVVGILDIKDLLNLDNKTSNEVSKVMSQSLSYIDSNDKLTNALTIILEKDDNVLIVSNSKRHTVGIITLKDIINALTGN